MANITTTYRRWRIRRESAKVVAERVFTPIRQAGRLAVLYRADDENKEKLLKERLVVPNCDIEVRARTEVNI